MKYMMLILFLVLFNPFYIFSQDIANSEEKKSELEKICTPYLDEDEELYNGFVTQLVDQLLFSFHFRESLSRLQRRLLESFLK